MKYLVDLAFVLGIAAVVIFCLMELSLVWGLVSLAIGAVLLLIFIQKRTSLFE